MSLPSFLRFLFLDGGRDGLQNQFWSSFANVAKPCQKRFHIVYEDASVKKQKEFRSVTATSQDRGCLNLGQLETVCVASGKNLNTIVGNRQNKSHVGSTASNCLQNVSKPDLSKLTQLDPTVKATYLGDSLVKDPRSKAESGGAAVPEPFSLEVMSKDLVRLWINKEVLYFSFRQLVQSCNSLSTYDYFLVQSC